MKKCSNKKKIDKHVNKIVRSFIPIGYWVYPDGEHIPLFKTPFKITQKIYLKFGVKYKEFNGVK